MEELNNLLHKPTALEMELVEEISNKKRQLLAYRLLSVVIEEGFVCKADLLNSYPQYNDYDFRVVTEHLVDLGLIEAYNKSIYPRGVIKGYVHALPEQEVTVEYIDQGVYKTDRYTVSREEYHILIKAGKSINDYIPADIDPCYWQRTDVINKIKHKEDT